MKIIRTIGAIYGLLAGIIIMTDAILSYAGYYSQKVQGVTGIFERSVILHYNISQTTNAAMIILAITAFILCWVYKQIK